MHKELTYPFSELLGVPSPQKVEQFIAAALLFARRKKPNGMEKEPGEVKPNQKRHQENAGLLHGLKVGGKGGVKIGRTNSGGEDPMSEEQRKKRRRKRRK